MFAAQDFFFERNDFAILSRGFGMFSLSLKSVRQSRPSRKRVGMLWSKDLLRGRDKVTVIRFRLGKLTLAQQDGV